MTATMLHAGSLPVSFRVLCPIKQWQCNSYGIIKGSIMGYQLGLVRLFANQLTASEQSGMTIPGQEDYNREHQWPTFVLCW